MPRLTEIEGIGPSLAAALVKSGYRTIAKISAATPAELSAIPGISKKGAPLIISSAKSLVEKSPGKTRSKKPVAPISVGKQDDKKERSMKSKKEVDALVKKKSDKIKKIKKKIKKLKKKLKKLANEIKKMQKKDSNKPK